MNLPADYRRLRWILLAFLIATLTLAGLGVLFVEHAERHATEVNSTSRQGILSQHMHRTLLQLGQPNLQPSEVQRLQLAVEEASREFNLILTGFANGYLGPDYLGDPVRLPALSDEFDVRPQIEQSLVLWQKYYRLLRTLGPSQAVSPQTLEPALRFASQHTDELLGLMEHLTRKIAAHTREEGRLLRNFQLVIALLIVAAGVYAYGLKNRIKLGEHDEKLRLEGESARLGTELFETKLQLRDVLQVSPDLIWVKDEKGIYKNCNRSYEEFKGRSPASLNGLAELDLYEGQQTMQERIRDSQLLALGRSIHVEVTLTSARDGHTGLFEVVRTPLRDANGSPAGVQTVARDISLRRQTESELRSTHERLLLLEKCVANINDALVITEADAVGPTGRRIQFVNEAFVRATGYSRDEVVGQTLQMLLGPKSDKSELAQLDRAYAAWAVGRAEVIIYAKDGREICSETVVTPISDGSNGQWYTHWVSVHRDISQRKREVVSEVGVGKSSNDGAPAMNELEKAA